jgi:monoamine oxidase
MAALVDSLGLAAFAQPAHGDLVYEVSATQRERVPGGLPDGGAMRLAGGMATLVDRLLARLPPGCLLAGHTVQRATRVDDGVALAVATDDGRFVQVQAARVVSTLPPRLLAARLAFEPALPAAVLQSWSAVPTWMAAHAKFVAVYPTPFWRGQGLSGHAQSRVGPLAEIHDASDPAGAAALFGFVGLPADGRQRAGAALPALALAQLGRLFGAEAARPARTWLLDWAQEPFTATASDAQAPRVHPSYGRQAAPEGPWAGRLLLAGSETAPEHGGYLEGALESSERVLAALRP